MAREIVVLDRSRPAASDLSASQFCAVILDTSGNVALSGTSGAIYGVLQNKPNATGKAAEVRVLGVTKMLVGSGGVTAGDLLTVTSAGACVTAASTGRYCIGWAEDTAASGAIATVLLSPQGKN